MMKINDLWKLSEFRIALNFGAAVFILVPLLGLLNSVPFGVVFKRILLAEMIFLPLGYGVGMVIRTFSLLESTQPLPGTIKEAVQTEKAEKTEAPLPAETAALEKQPGGPPADPLMAKPDKTSTVIVDNAPAVSPPFPQAVKAEHGPSRDAVDIPLEMPHAKPSQFEELSKLKQITQNDSMGKYMIINDRKIINEPEIIAKAVRTMMNRED